MSDSQEPESWDDEFELDDPSPSTSRPRTSLNDDDDNDFGVWGDDDEDRTLTARSRPAKAPTPPPPVPPIPAALQSPVPSVFSSGSNNSTTHLRPTISRTSAGRASVGFANLPPSPPIHQERRRLKKKSRPPHEGVYEMQEYPMSDEDLPATVTPMGSPTTGSPLLQRIGSVKSRFSAKKKRASSTPSDVVLQEGMSTCFLSQLCIHSLQSLHHARLPLHNPNPGFFAPRMPIHRPRNSANARVLALYAKATYPPTWRQSFSMETTKTDMAV